MEEGRGETWGMIGEGRGENGEIKRWENGGNEGG